MPELMGIQFSPVRGYDELVQELARRKTDGFKVVVTLNPEIWVRAQREPALAAQVAQAEWVVADGSGLRLAAAMLGQEAPAKITGMDLVKRLLEFGGWKVMLIGAAPPVVAETFRLLKNKHPNNEWVGFHHGYYGLSDRESVIEKIVGFSPDLVLVGMGSPKQDELLAQLRRRLPGGIGIGVGGVFDVYSGKFKRAPVWVQRIGMEWAFRVLQDPKRITRLGFIPRFLWAVLKRKVRRK